MFTSVIRCIIFDLDGTLVHSLPGIAASLNRTLKANHLPTHPEANVRRFIGDGMKMLVRRATPGIASTQLDALVEAMRSDYNSTWKEGTQPYPAVTQTLKTLSQKGILLTVLSNKPDEYCRDITNQLFPEINLPIVRGQRDDIPQKPDPTGALSICQELNIPTSETALVGDSTIDLETAKNADILPIAATWGYHDPPSLAAMKPQHTITSMDELIPALNP